MGDDDAGFAKCRNVSHVISMVITFDKATLHELDTVYGLEDVYDMLEILMVSIHNQRIAAKKSQEGSG